MYMYHGGKTIYRIQLKCEAPWTNATRKDAQVARVLW